MVTANVAPGISCMRLLLIDPPSLLKDPPHTNAAKPWDNAAIPPWRRRRDVAYQGRRRSLQTGNIRRAAVQDVPRLPPR